MKKTKLIVLRIHDQILIKTDFDRRAVDGSLWRDDIPEEQGEFVVDYSKHSKEDRNDILLSTRLVYPQAHYALLHMELNGTGKVTYDIVEL